MEGLMQDYPLNVVHIFEHGCRYFPRKEIVTVKEQGYHRYTVSEFEKRTRKLASALKKFGVQKGDRVATLAFNNYHHLECYFAIPCIGAVAHTLNLRLHPSQIGWIMNDAEDKVIFVQRTVAPVLAQIPKPWPVKLVVLMGEGPDPGAIFENTVDYEEFLSTGDEIEFEPIEENAAAGMCYTSGTTGDPKGVVYSHRSIFLHSFAVAMADTVGGCERDTVLTVVPMFHANAWGQCHSSLMVGSKQVLPDRFLSPDRLITVMQEEKVTVSAGVPTIWIGVLNELDKRSIELPHLRMLLCGGSAVPVSLIEGFARHGIRIVQGWGMTETSPLAAISVLRTWHEGLTDQEKFQIAAKQGVPPVGVEMRIVDLDTGKELPWDGKSIGEVQVKGPWIIKSYFKGRDPERFQDGWLKTGDVGTIDPDGYLQLVDRTKDLVKSGGEWISSVDLENKIMGHPSVMEAAVIGVRHEKWGERPIAIVVLKEEFKGKVSKQEILDFIAPDVAKWWLPDDVIFVDELPKTSVGKFDKKVLRAKYSDILVSQK